MIAALSWSLIMNPVSIMETRFTIMSDLAKLITELCFKELQRKRKSHQRVAEKCLKFQGKNFSILALQIRSSPAEAQPVANIWNCIQPWASKLNLLIKSKSHFLIQFQLNSYDNKNLKPLFVQCRDTLILVTPLSLHWFLVTFKQWYRCRRQPVSRDVFCTAFGSDLTRSSAATLAPSRQSAASWNTMESSANTFIFPIKLVSRMAHNNRDGEVLTPPLGRSGPGSRWLDVNAVHTWAGRKCRKTIFPLYRAAVSSSASTYRPCSVKH